MSLETTLRSEIQKAIKVLFETDTDQFQVQPTNAEFEGSHTLVCFPLTKVSKKNPEETAKAVGEYLVANSQLVAAYNVVKGFLNLSLKDSVWVEVFTSLFTQTNLGQLP
ncbi:MAG: arginine--tRNA ligase, partial [Cytophagia bacterium]|nr:arginine--tRNA ligase [Cytophagia bacterium]